MMRIGIIGGGPGGLIAAYLLEQKCRSGLDITLFEAGDRVGGKIVSRTFDPSAALYEGGVAELYDYSRLGPDPLRQLVQELGLTTIPMVGGTVVLDGHTLRNGADVKRHYGNKTWRAVKKFRKLGRRLIDYQRYYDAGWPHDNRHPWAKRSFSSVLQDVPNRMARRYLRVAVHSDLASEPHLTTGLYGLENCLMDVSGYVRLYSIEGGLSRLPEALAQAVSARIRLNCKVARVEATPKGYRLTFRDGRADHTETFDALVVALPVYLLGAIDWRGRGLARAIEEYRAYYDRPAHYLRVSILFREPFWRDWLEGAFFQLDAFGGCCVYDEGARYGDAGGAVLSWLMAGEEALVSSNLRDAQLVDAALASLPEPLTGARDFYVAGQVDRWVGSVNACPAGSPIRGSKQRHWPARKKHPGLVMVGDYLFDSTINGVMDSAEIATNLLLRHLRKHDARLPVAAKQRGLEHGGQLKNAYFDYYDGDRSYRQSFHEYFDAEWVVRLIDEVWGLSPPYRFLDAGSACGLTLAELAKHGIDAWGIENCAYIHAQTPRALRDRNRLGDVRDLPFEDDAFDIIYDTALCHVPAADVHRTICEYRRVARRGVFFSGLARDFERTTNEKDLFYGVSTLWTLKQWSEAFMRNGFRPAIDHAGVLSSVWKYEKKNDPRRRWYADADSMRHCFYTKTSGTTVNASSGRGIRPDEILTLTKSHATIGDIA
jgi:monoamine oxidase/SAM-dependent methyltransferase